MHHLSFWSGKMNYEFNSRLEFGALDHQMIPRRSSSAGPALSLWGWWVKCGNKFCILWDVTNTGTFFCVSGERQRLCQNLLSCLKNCGLCVTLWFGFKDGHCCHSLATKDSLRPSFFQNSDSVRNFSWFESSKSWITTWQLRTSMACQQNCSREPDFFYLVCAGYIDYMSSD